MPQDLRVSSRNAVFQQWRSLLTNRTKRRRSGEFLVQGVRPVTLAVERRWPLHAVLYCAGPRLSKWAHGVLDEVKAPRFAVAQELMEELGGRKGSAPEVLAVAEMPPDDLSRVPAGPDMLVVVLDRPGAPGNIGTVVRSADAFGASGVVLTGHGADPYDPKAVRASTGSIFAVPVVTVPGHREVIAWAGTLRQAGVSVRVIGTDEGGDVEVADLNWRRPTLVVVGNESQGLASAWRAACERVARIPMGGTASSLNASLAATIVLYEAAWQRRRGSRAQPALPT
jgi:TrmH family RNA methyltransferase